MKKNLNEFTERFFSTTLEFRVRLFNILALAATLMCAVVFVLAIVSGSDWTSALLCFISIFFSAGMLVYSQKTGKYKHCYYITIITVFFVIFPLIFFADGGYHSGMSNFFLFAVVFTVLMLEKVEAIIVSTLEIIMFLGISIYSYFNPQSVTYFTTEEQFLSDVLIDFLCASIVCGTVIFFHIREYREQQRQLADKNKELQRHNEAKSTFLTTVAHEIKNPLTAITVTAQDAIELIGEDPQDLELIRKNLHTVKRVVVNIDRILMDLMDTVSIEQGRLALSLESISLEDVIQEGVAVLSAEFKVKKNEIAYELEEVPLVTADYARLLQVVINLLSNSNKHTRNGKITIGLNEIDGIQAVTISDTGTGMAEKIKKEVFKGYVSMSEDYWRHGIGLYICHQIITAHEGAIEIESEEGRGTSVTFRLPKRGEVL